MITSDLTVDDVNVGDFVVCINNGDLDGRAINAYSRLTINKKYEVVEIRNNMLRVVADTGVMYGAYAERFILLKPKELKKEVW